MEDAIKVALPHTPYRATNVGEHLPAIRRLKGLEHISPLYPVAHRTKVEEPGIHLLLQKQSHMSPEHYPLS